jgi:mRNA-degrading endonuclease RelE of RelBE toxin-antitoxin system
MNFEQLDGFERDVKKLLKRYKTLVSDLEVLKKVLTAEPGERPPFSYRIDGLGVSTCVIKIKKIACKALKGRGANSGLRLIYAHVEEENKIVLIELYHKADKEAEDRYRILNNFE